MELYRDQDGTLSDRPFRPDDEPVEEVLPRLRARVDEETLAYVLGVAQGALGSTEQTVEHLRDSFQLIVDRITAVPQP